MKNATACLAGLLLGNLIAIPCTSEPPGDTARASETSNVDNPQEPVSEHDKQGWALGCAAVLTERNHDSHTLLGVDRASAGGKVGKKRLLADAWDINGREDFFKTMTLMDRGGHRANFEVVGRLISPLTEREFQALLAQESDPEMRNKLLVARRYYEQLGEKSLYGWDYSRAICLCRWAYVAGYIDEEEAWKRIMPMAILLQEKFDSWEDLGRNYLIGRQFWSLEHTQEGGWRCEDAFQRLLDMRSSPWNRYPWEMRLKEDQDGGIRPHPQEEQEPKEQEKNAGLIAAGNSHVREDPENG